MSEAPPADAPPQGDALPSEPGWPSVNSLRPVFLIDASSALEERLLRGWIDRNRPPGSGSLGDEDIRIPASRRRRSGDLARLEGCLASGSDAMLCPIRVAWLPRKQNGVRSARFSDVLRFGDPRDPGSLRQSWILRREPDRCRIVAGEPASISSLRTRWREAGAADSEQTEGLPPYVARLAALALERAERRLRGARYKVPRFVHEDILSRASFRGGITRMARELSRSEADTTRNATRYLREIAASHSPFVIDLVAHLIGLLYRQGYDDLHYEPEELASIRALAQQHPVVFLPSHKSNLDHLVFQYALHAEGLPPNHTAGGINMNFFPVGPLIRRSGVFFIRRTFKDNPLYKFVLHQYIDYLIEKRFSLEWYIEGGRSRSGKMLPPRFGMLAYVVDAYRRAKADDVVLIPVSIAYDQIGDVSEYAAEQRGIPKQRESFGWFVRFVRRLRRRYGKVHIRFGAPISLRQVQDMDRPEPDALPNPDDRSLELRKLAFEVAVRINRVTPVTAPSLVTLALLGTGDQALTVDETTFAMRNLLHYVSSRNLPTTGNLDLSDAEGVERTLDSLVANDVVSRFDAGVEPVFRIGPDHQLAAAYYRNTIIHFFVNSAIAELALLRAAEEDEGDPISGFWNAAMQLRDLLKFEFFFSEKHEFQEEIRQELGLHDGDWEKRIEEGPEGIRRLIRNFRPFTSHRVLRPFLEAYRIVGDHLELWNPSEPVEEERFLSECLGLGGQYVLQRRIKSAASASKVLLRTGLQVAENRGLLENVSRDIGVWRGVFAEEVRASIRRVDAIEALAASRRSGLID